MPDVGQDPVPAALEFDPTGEPARVPAPIDLVINPETGFIDFSMIGVDVPDVCDGEGMAVANCEFLQYLESLDGFPTVLPATAPVSDAVDMATAILQTNVILIDATAGELVDKNGLTLAFDEVTKQLIIDSPTGWQPGVKYVLGVKGGADGVKAQGGVEMVGSPIMFLLKKEESLLCGAADAEAISEDCPYYGLLFEMGMNDAEVREGLVVLEGLRQMIEGSGMWQALQEVAGMTKADAAVAWSFPTHSASVVEIDPSKPILPEVVSSTEIRLGFKGGIDSATAKVWSMAKPGNIFVLDLTELEKGDLAKGLPKATAAVDGDQIVLTLDAPFTDGHTMGLLISKGLTDEEGVAFVPSPVTVLLRASGPLVDESGKSLVDDISDGDAAMLEAGRKDLALLLDDEMFAGFTKLSRPDLVYVYAFDFPNP